MVFDKGPWCLKCHLDPIICLNWQETPALQQMYTLKSHRKSHPCRIYNTGNIFLPLKKAGQCCSFATWEATAEQYKAPARSEGGVCFSSEYFCQLKWSKRALGSKRHFERSFYFCGNSPFLICMLMVILNKVSAYPKENELQLCLWCNHVSESKWDYCSKLISATKFVLCLTWSSVWPEKRKRFKLCCQLSVFPLKSGIKKKKNRKS